MRLRIVKDRQRVNRLVLGFERPDVSRPWLVRTSQGIELGAFTNWRAAMSYAGQLLREGRK